MKIEKATTLITLSEEDLKSAIEYWLKFVHGQRVEIKHLEHLVGTRTDGFGHMEIDIPYQEGVKLSVVDLPDLPYCR